MEFVVPQADPSAFFPIYIHFTATDTFSKLKVRLDFSFFFYLTYGHGCTVPSK